MKNLRESAAQLAARGTDATTALLAAAWPRSAASREVARLVREGHRAGAPCEIAFSLAFTDPADAALAVTAAGATGYVVGTLDDAARGFVTVQACIRLRAYDLARAVTWLGRVAGAFGGFAAVIGPVDPAERVAADDARTRARLGEGDELATGLAA